MFTAILKKLSFFYSYFNYILLSAGIEIGYGLSHDVGRRVAHDV